MLKKTKKKQIPTVLTIEGQGEKQQFNLVYNNIGQEAVNALAEKAEATDDPAVILLGDGVAQGILHSWESEYDLSTNGIKEAEEDMPGFCVAVIEGYHLSRMVARAKN